MPRSLTARRVSRLRGGHETRRSHKQALGGRSLSQPGYRAATEPLSGTGGTQIQNVAMQSDFQVPQLAASLDRVIPSDLSLLDGTVAEVTAAIERTTCWERTDCIALALREAIANAIVHGNNSDPARAVRVSGSVSQECDLLITVKDSGLGFDPGTIADPTAAQNVLADHGRGVFLMKQIMDEVEFTFNDGTEVRMRKRHRWLE